MAIRLRLLSAAFALVFLVFHVQFLPRSLGDIDTINLALGVESFDVVQHRPHPPGYPVFIALARISTAVVDIVAPSYDRNRRAAIGLAVWGVIGGTGAVWLLAAFWRALRVPPSTAWIAAALAIVSPLFWFTTARPLTDAVALVAALVVQWVFVTWLGRNGPAPAARSVVAAAFAAGLLIGLRSQTMWLTGPLLIWVVVAHARRRDTRNALVLTGAACAGALAWAVPLVWSSGGLNRYLEALGEQGRQDFEGVRMLATSFEWKLFARALEDTLIAPWRQPWLGQIVLALALVGTVRLARRDRAALLVLACAFVPYTLFHLLFQEPETIRYALPVVVPMAGLAAIGMAVPGSRIAATFATLVILASAIVANESLLPYSREVPPTFRALQEARQDAAESPDPPVMFVHGGMRRVADWYRPEWPALPAQPPSGREWLAVVDHLRSGAARRVWYLTDRRRTDIAMFDPRSRGLVGEYLRNENVRDLIGEARLDEVTWLEIVEPRWMLGEGWALSPETGGVAFATGHEPHLVPSLAYLRRDPAPHRLMIGGRRRLADGDARLVVTIDGRDVAAWPVAAGEPPFVRWLELPPGALEGKGTYATVSVRVDSADRARLAPAISLDQFDAAPVDVPMAALTSGWHAPEQDGETTRLWRWAEGRATVRVYGAHRGAHLLLGGKSSMRDFDAPSTVVVRVGDRELARIGTERDFAETIALPPAPDATTPVDVVIESDRVFRPADRHESTDTRELAVRFVRVEVEP